jgi:uncharacterized protein YjbJ (UPF0337 family)
MDGARGDGNGAVTLPFHFLHPRPAIVAAPQATTRRRFRMDDNRSEGAERQIKGTAKELHGKLTGNTSKEIAGKIEKNIGKAQRNLGEAADEVRDAKDD